MSKDELIRDLLQTLVDENPKATEAELFKLFRDAVGEDEEMIREIVDYYIIHATYN